MLFSFRWNKCLYALSDSGFGQIMPPKFEISHFSIPFFEKKI